MACSNTAIDSVPYQSVESSVSASSVKGNESDLDSEKLFDNLRVSPGRTYNILIVGVGGQGIILAGDVLSRAAAKHGYDVKKNEIHGMAQRGGSVSSHVRFGPQISSPVIKMGEADVLLSFEQLETVRYLPFLSTTGKVIVNDLKILPPSVFTGKQEYPPDIVEKIKERVPGAVVVDGAQVAERLGNPRVVNVIFLGVLSSYLDIPEETYEEVLGEVIKPKLVEINVRAFREGRDLMKK